MTRGNGGNSCLIVGLKKGRRCDGMRRDKTLSSNQKHLIIAWFLLVVMLSSLIAFSLSVFVFQILMGIFVLYFCLKTDYKTAKLWLTILTVSVIFVFIVYLANQLYYGCPYFNGGSDDLNYELWGFDVYKSGIYNPSKMLRYGIIGEYHNSPFFASYVAVLILFSNLFGKYTTFLPRIANAYYLLFTSMIMKYLLKKYTPLKSETIYYSLVYFSLMPIVQFISAHVFRDVLNLLQILLIVLLIDFLLSKKSYLLKVLSMVSLPCLLYVTYYNRAGSVLYAACIAILMLSVKHKIKKRYIITAVILVLSLSNLLEAFRLPFYIETYSRYLSSMSGEGLSRFVFSKPLLPLGIFLRAVYALISPFPNFFDLFKNTSKLLFDFVQLLINFGVLVQTSFTPFLIRRTLKLDWLALSYLLLFMATIVTTFTFRHFILFYPFMSAVAMDGFLTTKPNTRKVILFLSVATVMDLGILYISLKIFSRPAL